MAAGLETVMMTLMTERSNTLETTITDKIQQMEERNEEIRSLQELLQILRGEISGDIWSSGAVSKAPRLVRKLGIDLKSRFDEEPDSGKLEADIAYIESSIDQLSSGSQLDMINLQGMINKRNQTMEMMTNLLSKFSRVTDTTVRNLR